MKIKCVLENDVKLMRLLADGYMIKECADVFGVKPETVRKRLEKMRVGNRCSTTIELTCLFMRAKLIK
jgi:DNA-binding NarL/FixJ family response regulator